MRVSQGRCGVHTRHVVTCWTYARFVSMRSRSAVATRATQAERFIGAPFSWRIGVSPFWAYQAGRTPRTTPGGPGVSAWSCKRYIRSASRTVTHRATQANASSGTETSRCVTIGRPPPLDRRVPSSTRDTPGISARRACPAWSATPERYIRSTGILPSVGGSFAFCGCWPGSR